VNVCRKVQNCALKPQPSDRDQVGIEPIQQRALVGGELVVEEAGYADAPNPRQQFPRFERRVRTFAFL